MEITTTHAEPTPPPIEGVTFHLTADEAQGLLRYLEAPSEWTVGKARLDAPVVYSIGASLATVLA